MGSRRSLVVAGLMLPFLLGLSGCGGGGSSSVTAQNPAGVQISGVTKDATYRGTVLATPYRMPDITLRADNGNPFNLVRDTAYPVTLVFFGYSHCPDECPLILSGLASTYLRLPPPVRADTQVIFITTDPRRDDDAVLRHYLARFNPRFVGLTGRLSDILAAAKTMGVAVSGMERLPGGGYDVGHSTQVIGFRGNEAPVIWPKGTPVNAMVADIEKLAR